ncbi:endo-beta-N-acetylglucosaminidase [Saccharicrinis fermentans]|uniref:endo-beta-N-acetylglucosaminidase n=1 Tax=Saccharicrinis fermentans TaxID=982 RepID=UPI001F2B0973|nr:hypothetical protein [Saccharicrinis fermentans]
MKNILFKEALFLMFFSMVSVAIKAQLADTLQPYSAYWFIDELLEWDVSKDADAIYNRSFTSLATKYYNPDFKVNSHARANEAKVEVLPIFAPTSSNPSQGSLVKDYYAFTYWQYCDLMVYWGGSSYEGMIVAPPAPVIDAAHRNGVPVYGTVFFPPMAYGGKREWVSQFVQHKDGIFPVADKLIEVAKYFGFDGWFINQETGKKGEVEQDFALAKAMQEFMIYYKKHSDLSIQWYDAMLNDGTVNWQHEINDRNQMFFQSGDTLVSDQMFLDFRYNSENLRRTKKKVEKLGRNIYDVYGGIDVQNNGYETEIGYTYPQGANFNVLFPEGESHAASLAFYVPSWTFSSAKNIYDFYQRESRFWVGEKGNPAKTETSHNWKGVAYYVPAKTAVTKKPFVTNFCTGHGEKYFRNGEDVTSVHWRNGWNNLSLQDIQPTWRWVVESEKLSIGYDFTDAYNGGNCLEIKGYSNENDIIPLFGTRLDVTNSTVLRIGCKKLSHSDVNLLLTFENGKEKIIPIYESNGEEWCLDSFNIGNYEDQKLCRIALMLGKGQNHHVRIGQLSVIDRVSSLPSVSGFSIEEKAEIKHGVLNMRVKWERLNQDVFYYRIYKINANGQKSFLGGTTSNACFLPMVPKRKDEKLTLAIEAVGMDYVLSPFSLLEVE